MPARSRELHETVIVRVSILGSTGEGIGTHDVRIAFGEMSDAEIGSAMASAFRHALTPAIEDFAPHLANKWTDQAKRDRADGV